MCASEDREMAAAARVVEAASDRRYSDEFVGNLLRANLSAVRSLVFDGDRRAAQERLLAQGKVPEAMMLETPEKGSDV